MTSTARPAAAPAERSRLAAVALPSEHGGWGLTGEPALLGLLVAPGVAALAFGLAAVGVFLLRTPLRIVLVDRHRGRSLPRTRLAGRVVGGEAAAVAALVVVGAAWAHPGWWWPVVAAAPLVAVSLWFEARSRSRRLLPELAGSLGITAVVAVIACAGGRSTALALGLWLVLGARAVTSVTYAKHQVARLHDRPVDARVGVVADGVAVAAAVVAAVLDHRLVVGAVVIAVIVGVQRVTARRPVPAKVLGLRQTGFGLAVVVVTALAVQLL